MKLIHSRVFHSYRPRLFQLTAVFVLLSGTAILMESCCACTLRKCSDEVVFITLTAPNDTNFEVCELLAIRWSTDHASGESLDAEIENQMAKFRVPSAADFENGDIIEVGTKKLNIELYCNAVLVLAEEYELFWNDYVCNKCTDRPWCDDGITSTASISIEINPTEFPVDQN